MRQRTDHRLFPIHDGCRRVSTTLDRYRRLIFFTNDMGGNVMMYISLIWAGAIRKMYILILPVFGVFSEIAATFSRKRLFGYTSLVWATVCITVLSFIVWLPLLHDGRRRER